MYISHHPYAQAEKMRKQKWDIALAVIIFVLAFGVRYRGYVERAPFDWDQNRDYGEVRKIVQGQPVPLGPVAKGAGGFYLGSLYYYLLAPGYMISGGNPRSLPITSMAADALTAVLLYLLLRRLAERRTAMLASLLWAVSWHVIDSSRISWNVALIPSWSIAVLYAAVRLAQTRSRYALYTLGLLAGISCHIHVSAIPLVPVISLFVLRYFRFPLRDWLIAGLCALVPLIPLIYFDMTHGFMNIKLARSLMAYQSSFHVAWSDMIIMAVTKLGKVVQGLIMARFADSFAWGCAVIAAAIGAVIQKNMLIRLSGVFILTACALVVALHDIGFPEYYFGTAYISIFIITVHLLRKLRWVGLIVTAYILLVNIRAYTLTATPFSLSVKEEIAESVAEYKSPVDVRMSLDPGRDGGFGYLLERAGVVQDSMSPVKVLITDKVESPAYIDGELATDTFRAGFIKTSVYVVQ